MTKRVAEKQITKDNPRADSSGSEAEVQEKREKASEEVLASRKILTVKRGAAKQAPPADKLSIEGPKSPKKETVGLFAGLSGLASSEPREGSGSPKKGLFAGLSNLATIEEKSPKKGGLFSGISSLAAEEPKKGGSIFGEPAGGIFGAPAGDSLFSSSSFSFTAPSFPSFGESPEASEAEEEEQEPEVPAVAQSDELEGEEQIYQTDCKLFKLMKEDEKSESMKWIEKCIGFVRLLKKKEEGSIRLVVRMKGVFRLILNIALLDKICRAEKQGNKSVRFNGIEEDGSLGMFRLNLLTEDQQAAFLDLLPSSLKQ